MSNTALPFDISKERRHLDGLGGKLLGGGLAAGIIGLAASLVLAAFLEDGLERFWSSYLVNFAYFLSLSLGALFFVIVQHLTRAGWSVVLRRVAEAIAANLSVLFVIFIPLLFGLHHIYHWTAPVVAAQDKVLAGKLPYLNQPFFIARCLVYFALWSWLASYFFKRSTEQDESGNPQLTSRMERLSAPAMVAYAFSVTFAAFDILMSLDPHWFSTIFGVYYFAGGVVGFFALLVASLFMLQRAHRLRRAITPEHYHDLGKFLLAFVVFWSYIAFSQYMLMWYGDIPEETAWYLTRQSGDWVAVSIAMILGHFFIPFLALLSRYPKRRPYLLLLPALWVLLFHWLDLYWLIVPELSPPGRAPLGLMDLTLFLAMGGVFVAGFAYRLRDKSLIPERDPRLEESLAFENA